MSILKIENLNFSYSENVIFDDLSFSIEENSINAVVGTNSSGKTTFIKILSGILFSNNNIELNNIKLNKKNIKEYSRLIGVCLFDNFLFEDVISELVFSLENLNFSNKEIDERLKDVCSLLDIKKLKNKKISKLSEFDKVRVALASSVIHLPKVIFLDDIFEKLTYEEYIEISKYLNKIVNQYNITILYTTNKLENCLCTNKVIFIDEGKIILEGPIGEVLKHDNILAKNGLIVPTMIDLSLKLQFYGLVDEVIMDVEGLVDRLWQ